MIENIYRYLKIGFFVPVEQEIICKKMTETIKTERFNLRTFYISFIRNKIRNRYNIYEQHRQFERVDNSNVFTARWAVVLLW